MILVGISPALVRKDHGFVRSSHLPERVRVSLRYEKRRDIISYISLDKLRQVDVPNFKRNGECEQLHTTFIDLK